MWGPLAIAVVFMALGSALLVARRLAVARGADERGQGTEMVPMPLLESPALVTPSRLAAAASRPEPQDPKPAPRVADESKLSPKQRERLEKLMAAVKAEFQGLLEEEKRKSKDA